jgi:[1-hydroxy-2-(trimethylamino)ethyl]phosphonate dioxygenase
MSTTIIDDIFALLTGHGQAAYLGESVSQAEHAVQAAWAAEQAGAESALVVAALLHDIGHLLHHHGEQCARVGHDDRHEERGQVWLQRWFGPEVTEPVRLHVAAKRYLSAVEPAYREGLSEASVRSLQLQGGPFTPAEVSAFLAEPHARAAVALRRWDEAAKVAGLAIPEPKHFRRHLERVLARHTIQDI